MLENYYLSSTLSNLTMISVWQKHVLRIGDRKCLQRSFQSNIFISWFGYVLFPVVLLHGWGHINIRGLRVMVWRQWTSRRHVTVLVFPMLTWGVIVRSRCQSIHYRGGNWSRVAVKIGRFQWWYRAVRSSHSNGGRRVLDGFILVLVRWGQAGWSRCADRHRWQFQSSAEGFRLLVVCVWLDIRVERD